MLGRFAPALAVVALVGCGGGTSTADRNAIDQAAAKTANVRTYDLATSSSFKVPGTKKRVTFRGIGAFNAPQHRGKLALDFTPLASVTGQNFGIMLLVLDGSIVYLKLPFLRQSQPSLKPWLKMNIGQTGNAQGFTTFLQFGQGGDPSQTLGYLRGAGKVKKVGSDKVRGVKTTRYEATVELAKVAKRTPAEIRDRVRRAIDELIRLTGQKTIAVDTWLDDQGRVRRLKYRQKMTLGNQKTEVAQAMELYDFGKPVAIVVPSRDQVTDLTVSGS